MKAFIVMTGLGICITTAFSLGALLKDFELLLEAGAVSTALVLLVSGLAQAARRRRRLEGDITLSWAAISAVLPFVWRAT
jgi:cation transporter-like permease